MPQPVSSAALHLLDRHRPFLHLALPLAAGLLLVSAFHSGIGWLTHAVVPARSYELGAPELLQIAALLLGVWVAWRASRAAAARRRRRARLGFLAVLAGLAVLLLDEVEYGRHLYDWLTDVSPASRASAMDATAASAWPGLAVWLLLGLVALRLLVAGSRVIGVPWSAALARATPSWWHVATLVVLLGAVALVDAVGAAMQTDEAALARLVTALRELATYYVGALLTYEVAARCGLSPHMRFRLPPTLVVQASRRRRDAPPPPVADGTPPRLAVIRGGAADAPARRRTPAPGPPAATPRTRTLGATARIAAWTARSSIRGTPADVRPSPLHRRPTPDDLPATPITGRRRWLRPILPGSGEGHDLGPLGPSSTTNGGPSHGSPGRQ